MLGAGGMGEVYRAHDHRLGRDVAVKVLPAVWVSDADRRERFEREARAVAALNHPNIVAVHDVGTDAGVPFIVSELLEGATLRELMTPGAPWPVRKAVEVTLGIAHGLAAAHSRGVIHRDLKPENVFIGRDGVVKLLDFGLARITLTPASAGEGSTLAATGAGTVLGTAGYMAPEQVRGLPADHRADIFACGAILLEMLSGRRAFAAGSSAEIMTAILTKDPLAERGGEPSLPPPVERIVARCLEKTPEARFQSASDLAFALEGWSGASDVWIGGKRAPAPRRIGGFAAAAGIALVTLSAAYLAGRYFSESPSAPPLTRLQIAAGIPVMDLAVSLDGRSIAYLGAPPGSSPAIWLRSLDHAASRRVAATEGASTGFFWSPDSRFLAFVSGGRLRKLDVGTGSVLDICAFPGGTGTGGTWNDDDTILFGSFPSDGLYQVPANGGTPRLVTRIDRAAREGHAWPRFVPGSRRFLYSVVGPDEICVGSLDTDERRCITKGVWFDYDPSGVLLFARGSQILAQALSVDSLELQGTPVAVAGLVSHAFTSGAAIFAAGRNVLAVRPEEPRRTEQLTWYDREGRALGTVGAPDPISTFDLSPDGRRVVIARTGPPPGGGEVLLVIDTARGVTSRLTGREFAAVDDPVWSPDSRQVAFRAVSGGNSILVVKPVDGGAERVVIDGQFDEVFLEGWSPDGRYLAISIWEGSRRRGALLPVDGKPEPITFVETANEEADFSPDGRWLAYSTSVDAGSEVFVVPVPPTGERWQVSDGGGDQPRWRRDGRELFYLALDGTLMAVSVSSGRRFEGSAPRPLFRTGLVVVPSYDQFDVGPDGRFLLTMPADPFEGTVIDVVLNWQSVLKR
jgi:Tol biopolymer transport system component